MNRLTRIICACSLLLCLGAAGARAQMFSTSTVSPAEDSLSVLRLRSILDGVRRTQHRPTVAVVLSGGGAKGAAELGVLKYMEELRIPVDFICGTSIGGLLGGMYAMGYSSDYLDSLVRSINWDTALTDRIPKPYVSYRDRRARERYSLAVPFGAGDRGGDGPREGLSGSLLSTLPGGLYTGLNVSNVLNSISVRYQDPMDFADLPIPFCCVASDLVSCKAKYFFGGSLVQAMRATMSVPLLFTPVRTDGMVLMDGGLLNNFPADIAKAAGADIIIGVDLGEDNLTFDEINNMLQTISPMIDMISNDVMEYNKSIPDLMVKPDISGYNMMSFGDEPMKILYDRGYKAAQQMAEEFAALKERIGPGSTVYRASPALDINMTPVVIGDVLFEGLEADEAEYMRSRMDIVAGEPADRRKVERELSQMFSTGAFKTISYRIEGQKEPYSLVYSCVKSQPNEMRLGVRADNEEMVSLLLSVGLGSRRLSGSQLDLEAKIGKNSYLTARFAYDVPKFPTVNFDVSMRHSEGDLIAGRKDPGLLAFNRYSQMLYLSEMHLRRYDVNLGVRNDYFHITRYLSPDGGRLPQDTHYDDFSLFASGRFNTLDNAYFPRRGISVAADYQWVFASPGRERPEPMHILAGSLLKAFPMGNSWSMSMGGNARYVLNREGNLAQSNIIGGSMAGRYIDQQIPFCGFDYVTVVDDFLVTAALGVTWRPARNHFLTLRGGAFTSAGGPFEFSSDNKIYAGTALEYGYMLPLGPVRANVHWSSFTRRAGFYVCFGFDF